MKLKLACEITAGLIIVSFFMVVAGIGLSYLPQFSIRFDFRFLLLVSMQMLGTVFASGGFLIFLLGFIRQLDSTVVHRQLYITAGVCVLLSILVATGNFLTYFSRMQENISSFRFTIYMAMFGSNMLMGICLSMFFFQQCRQSPPPKTLAAVTLAFMLITLTLGGVNTAISFSEYPYEHIKDNLINFAGYAIVHCGYLGKLIANVFFMIAFLTLRRPQLEFDEDNSESEFARYTDY